MLMTVWSVFCSPNFSRPMISFSGLLPYHFERKKQPVSEPSDQTRSQYDTSLHVPEAKSFECPNGYGPGAGTVETF